MCSLKAVDWAESIMLLRYGLNFEYLSTVTCLSGLPLKARSSASLDAATPFKVKSLEKVNLAYSGVTPTKYGRMFSSDRQRKSEVDGGDVSI